MCMNEYHLFNSKFASYDNLQPNNLLVYGYENVII